MNYILDNVQCKGNETSLFDCEHNGINKHNCGKNERAGVECIGKENQFYLLYSFIVCYLVFKIKTMLKFVWMKIAILNCSTLMSGGQFVMLHGPTLMLE